MRNDKASVSHSMRIKQKYSSNISTISGGSRIESYKNDDGSEARNLLYRSFYFMIRDLNTVSIDGYPLNF